MSETTLKIAIVTGGGAGLGRAICLRLARDDIHVAVVGRRLEPIQETVNEIMSAGGNAHPFVCDVTDAHSVRKMAEDVFAHYGRIDYLVNNVGRAFESRTALRLCDTEESLWDESIRLNLDSVFFCSKYVIPYIIESGGGAVCNISSAAGYLPAFGASYAAAKAAVIALTKSIALQYADDNVRCNCVCPGPMKTPGGISANKVGTIYSDSAAKTRLKMIDRVADPMEMANAVAFLLGDEASYITGTEIKVDGGTTALSAQIPPRRKS